MPRYNFDTVGDLMDVEYLRGTIQTIDSATDTCTVNVAGSVLSALFFYHCTPDSEIREDNGAIKGAAAGFSVGDEVVVQVKYDYGETLVIAHVDGVKRCGFQFKFTRGDGTPVDDTMLYYIDVYTSSYIQVPIDYTYDPDTGYFSITFTDPDDADDPAGYWVAYNCTDGVYTQYPYNYKYDDQWQLTNLLKPGAYEDVIPYFKSTLVLSGCVESEYIGGGLTAPIAENLIVPSYYNHLILKPGGMITKTLTVKSSIPYSVRYDFSLWDGQLGRLDNDREYFNNDSGITWHGDQTYEPGGHWRNSPFNNWIGDNGWVPLADGMLWPKAVTLGGDVSWSFQDGPGWKPYGSAYPSYVELKSYHEAAAYQSQTAITADHVMTVTDATANISIKAYRVQDWVWYWRSFALTHIATEIGHRWSLTAQHD